MAHEWANASPQAAESEGFHAADPFQGISDRDKLSAAVQYTEAGLRIFPIEPNSKRPHRDTHGFKDASSILHSLDNHPGLENLGWYDFVCPNGDTLTVNQHDNWAIEPGSAGFTVIDIDPKNGGDKTWAALIAKHGPVTTREVNTPGGGRHLWCRGVVTAINKTLGPGIDTRCFGGYVMLPPSSIHCRYYDWVDPSVPIAPLSEWVREILEAQARRTPGESCSDTEVTEAHLAWLETGGEGGDFDYRLSLIGDEASGGEGFYSPMLSAAGYGVRIGMDLAEVIARIEEAALAAPRGKRSLSYVREKLAELRHHAVPKFRQRDQDKDQKAAAQKDTAEGADPSKAAEPTGEGPTGSQRKKRHRWSIELFRPGSTGQACAQMN